MNALHGEVLTLEEKQSRSAQADDTASLVDAISELTRTIIALQTERTTLEAIGDCETEYVGLLNDRKAVQDELASLEGGAG